VTRRKHANGRSNISVDRKAFGSTLKFVEEYLAQYDAGTGDD